MSDRQEGGESGDDAEGWVPLEDRAEEQSSETLDAFGGVNSEGDLNPFSDDDTEGDDDALYPWAEGRGSTSGDAPWVGGDPPEEVVGPDVPGYVEWVGQSGVYLGVAGLALALAGVSLASVNVQPFANMALVFSLVAVFVAMFLGIVFQVYVSTTDA